MALKGVLHREYHVSFDRKAITDEEPIGVRLVDINVRWLLWGRRVGIGVRCVNFNAYVSFMCTDSEEHAHTWVLDAG